METVGLRLETPIIKDRGRDLSVADAISPADPMWVHEYPDAAEAQYLESAASALRCIRLALRTVRGHPKRILDMGCGYGRVLRAIRAAYPNAEIAACDIVHDAVDFCVEHFDALPVYSEPDVSGSSSPASSI